MSQSDTRSGKSTGLRPWFVTALIVGALVLGGVLVLLLLGLALRPVLFPSEPSGIPLEVPRGGGGGGEQPLPSSVVVIEVGDTAVAMPVPVELEVGGLSFPVEAASPEAAGWIGGGEAAYWVHGTVVNYVFGIEATPDNLAFAGQLEEGDQIVVHLSSGAILSFRIATVREIGPDEVASLFSQFQPGLTLMVGGGGEGDGIAVLSEFDHAESAPTQPGAVIPRQRVQVGDVQVVVEEGYAVAATDLPPGTLAYLVEFSVRNTASSPLDPTPFVMELVDGLGNRYQPSSAAAALGMYGPLTTALTPTVPVSATAGYLIPAGLTGSELTWVFGPHAASELRAYFTLSYTVPSAALPVPQVDVTDAFLDGETLHVVATVGNDGGSPLQVDETDVSLSSNAGAGELQMAVPSFPWTIHPGDSREVELVFARPDASAVVVTILGYTFEISGLP